MLRFTHRNGPAGRALDSSAQAVLLYYMPTLTLRVSPAEMSQVRRLARASGKNVSAYVRGSVLPVPARAPRTRLVRDKATGALILRHPPGTPPVTLEQVKSILADFP